MKRHLKLLLPSVLLGVAVSSGWAPAPRAAGPAAQPPAAPASAPGQSAIQTNPAPCTCSTARDTNGWCEAHGIGYVAGIPIPSKLLYEALDAHGHTIDLSTLTCASCKRAAASNGYCEEHRIGFVRAQAYFSRLTYELARGTVKDPATIVCPVCRKHAQSRGWCRRCRIGMVGKIAIEDAASYRRIVAAINILLIANKAAERCIYCALAIVTDTQCPLCRITYRKGRPVLKGKPMAAPVPTRSGGASETRP